MRSALVACLLLGALFPGAAAAGEADRWLEALYRRVAADLGAGRPMVAQVHVALCDNRVIPCGSRKLGDGDNPDTNLYWATTGGFRGWLSRRGSGWTRVHRRRAGDREVIEVGIWRRTVEPGPAWRRLGVTRPFPLYVVAKAWRGTAIDAALEAYIEDLYGAEAEAWTLDDGTRLDAGGAAQVVAFVGHNRWMDRPPYDFAGAARRHRGVAVPKGTLAIACATEGYLAREVPSATRVPLAFTTDLMFASSPAFDYAVQAFARAASFAELRRAAAEGYAAEQHKPIDRVMGLFTNPSHARWHGPR